MRGNFVTLKDGNKGETGLNVPLLLFLRYVIYVGEVTIYLSIKTLPGVGQGGYSPSIFSN